MIFRDEEHQDAGPSGHHEPYFTYLQRSSRSEAQRIRDVMEDWFSRFPSGEQPDLLGRLSSTDDHAFLGAYFELFVHQLLLRLGGELEVHPDPETGTAKRPDFIGCGAFVECTLATEPREDERRATRFVDRFVDELNERVESDRFYLGIQPDRAPDQPVSSRHAADALQPWLDSLDWADEIRRVDSGGDLPEKVIPLERWAPRFVAFPKRTPSRDGARIVGSRTSWVRMVNPAVAYRRALKAKAGRYGLVRRPYVIAVNLLGRPEDPQFLLNALFGTGAIEESQDSPLRISQRDGIWFGPNGPQNTRVSAVLGFANLDPWTAASRQAMMIHNPWASSPYTGEFDEIASFRVENDSALTREGATMRDLIGLPIGWPENG